MNIWLIDHYDSFTNNVRDWLMNDPAVRTVNLMTYDDRVGLATVEASNDPVVLSPGPNSPENVTPTVELVRRLLGHRPILGICLGHQILARIAGAQIKPLTKPIHGIRKTFPLSHQHQMWEGLTNLEVAIYNSLGVSNLPAPQWEPTLKDKDGVVLAMSSTNLDWQAWGWQFHPESFLAGSGEVLCRNWVKYCEEYYASASAPLPIPSNTRARTLPGI